MIKKIPPGKFKYYANSVYSFILRRGPIEKPLRFCYDKNGIKPGNFLMKGGFTLIELLIIIAIIGITASIAFVLLNGAKMKSRDARRMSDVKVLKTAIELYIDAYGIPPLISASANPWRDFLTDLQPYMKGELSTTNAHPLAYCQSNNNDEYYVVGSLLEQHIIINGDVDGDVLYVCGECVYDSGSCEGPINCNDGETGYVRSGYGTAYCLGYADSSR